MRDIVLLLLALLDADFVAGGTRKRVQGRLDALPYDLELLLGFLFDVDTAGRGTARRGQHDDVDVGFEWPARSAVQVSADVAVLAPGGAAPLEGLGVASVAQVDRAPEPCRRPSRNAY